MKWMKFKNRNAPNHLEIFGFKLNSVMKVAVTKRVSVNLIRQAK